MAIDIKTEDIEIIGADELARLFDSLLTSDPDMDALVRKLIRKELREARNRTSREIAGYIENDPRKAAKAVKNTVYKKLFGGNISILSKRRASSTRVTLNKIRKVDQAPPQRGGNRRKVSERTKQLESYYGSDRGFILRFLNAGTKARMTKYGNRGAITANNMFVNTAPRHLLLAVESIVQEIENYIAKEANG